jgi:hypothetical protein
MTAARRRHQLASVRPAHVRPVTVAFSSASFVGFRAIQPSDLPEGYTPRKIRLPTSDN